MVQGNRTSFSVQFSVFSWWNRGGPTCAGLILVVLRWPPHASQQSSCVAALHTKPLNYRSANINREHPLLQLKTEH